MQYGQGQGRTRNMNILVVSPHPDDETLGAGGTILKLLSQGHQIFWLNMTGMFHSDKYSKEEKVRRKEQLNEIAQFYKFSSGGGISFKPADNKIRGYRVG